MSQNCLICDIILPELRDRTELLEAELRGALCMLDLIKAEQGSLYIGTVEQFIRDRDELNETFKRLTSG
jgi:hypothetical protein